MKSRVGENSKGDTYVAARKSKTPTKTSTSLRAVTLFGESMAPGGIVLPHWRISISCHMLMLL